MAQEMEFDEDNGESYGWEYDEEVDDMADDDVWEEQVPPYSYAYYPSRLVDPRDTQGAYSDLVVAEEEEGEELDLDILGDYNDEQDGLAYAREASKPSPFIPELPIPSATRSVHSYPLTPRAYGRTFEALVAEGNPGVWEIPSFYTNGFTGVSAIASVPPVPYRSMRTQMSLEVVGNVTYLSLFFNVPFTWKRTASSQNMRAGIYRVDHTSLRWKATLALIVVAMASEFSAIIPGAYGALVKLAAKLVRSTGDVLPTLAALWSDKPRALRTSAGDAVVHYLTEFDGATRGAIDTDDENQEGVTLRAFYGQMDRTTFNALTRMY